MTQGHDDQGRQDVGLYEKILKRTEEILESGRKNLDDALRKASDELSGAGEFTRRTGGQNIRLRQAGRSERH